MAHNLSEFPEQNTHAKMEPMPQKNMGLFSKCIYVTLLILIFTISLFMFMGENTSASEIIVSTDVELIQPEISSVSDNPMHLQAPLDEQTEMRNIKLKASTWSGDYQVMLKNIHLYDEIHPFIYSLKGKRNNQAALVSSWSHKQKLERVAELRKKNPSIKIIPTIFRWENPAEKILEVIGMNNRADIRDKHIENIVHETVQYGYDGIDIDYEGMHCSKKEKFEDFIIRLSSALKKERKILSIAVHPRTPADKPTHGKYPTLKCKGLTKNVSLDFRENWRGPQTHDYEFLAKYADMIKIMAYELHPRRYKNPGPGPQAPGKWLTSIIEYASGKVPAGKLYMAIPTYGYDWGLNCKVPVKSVYHSDVRRIMKGKYSLSQPTDITSILQTKPMTKSWTNLRKFRKVHKGKIYEDPALWYSSGGCQRVAFFMNKKAFAQKMEILQKNKLAGFSFWQLTADNDPEIHNYLSEKLNKSAFSTIGGP